MATLGPNGAAAHNDAEVLAGRCTLDINAHEIDMSEFISVPMTATEKPRAIKYRGIVYFFRSVKGKTHGMILDRPHLEMLQTRLSALANLRSLARIWRVPGVAFWKKDIMIGTVGLGVFVNFVPTLSDKTCM